MAKAAQPQPSLADLRKEIDRIDEAMHRLLMERGEIIDRLIAVKKSQETGSAFRPAREAEMMRRLVKRHKGILPLDTAESIWRVIISTFTYVQAPFSVHADLSAGDALMRDSRALPFRLHGAVRRAYGRGRRGRGGVGLEGRSRPGAGLRRGRRPAPGGARSNSTPRRRSSRGCRSSSAPIIRPRCRCSCISRVAADAMVTEAAVWSVRVAGWGAERRAGAVGAGRFHRRARPRLRRRRAADLAADRA